MSKRASRTPSVASSRGIQSCGPLPTKYPKQRLLPAVPILARVRPSLWLWWPLRVWCSKSDAGAALEDPRGDLRQLVQSLAWKPSLLRTVEGRSQCPLRVYRVVCGRAVQDDTRKPCRGRRLPRYELVVDPAGWWTRQNSSNNSDDNNRRMVRILIIILVMIAFD